MYWQALTRLLALLAVASLALAPVTAAAAVVGTGVSAMAMVDQETADPDSGMATVAMDAMPCCPPAKPAMPDCQKGCPLAALCLAKLSPALPALWGVPVPVAAAQTQSWWMAAAFRSLASPPPPEPPRT